MSTFEFELNTRKPQSEIMQVTTRVGDNDTTMRVTILDGDEPYDFAGKYLEFAMVRTDGKWVHLKECVTQIEDNIWECTLPPEALATSGIVTLAYFVVRDEEDGTFRDSTQRVQIIVDNSATGNADIGPYSDQLDALIREATMLLDAWETQLKSQKYEFDHAMDVWADRFSKAVQAWKEQQESEFQQSQTERDTAFEASEQSRTEAFEQAEAAREQKSDAATERANTAAEKIEKALVGDLDDLFGDWIDAQKDTEGGLVSYDAMVRGDYVSVDDVSIQSNEGQLSIKESGVTTDLIADGNVTTPKLAEGAVTESVLADGAVTREKLGADFGENLARFTGMTIDPAYGEISEGFVGTYEKNIQKLDNCLDSYQFCFAKYVLPNGDLLMFTISGTSLCYSVYMKISSDHAYLNAFIVSDDGVFERHSQPFNIPTFSYSGDPLQFTVNDAVVSLNDEDVIKGVLTIGIKARFGRSDAVFFNFDIESRTFNVEEPVNVRNDYSSSDFADYYTYIYPIIQDVENPGYMNEEDVIAILSDFRTGKVNHYQYKLNVRDKIVRSDDPFMNNNIARKIEYVIQVKQNVFLIIRTDNGNRQIWLDKYDASTREFTHIDNGTDDNATQAFIYRLQGQYGSMAPSVLIEGELVIVVPYAYVYPTDKDYFPSFCGPIVKLYSNYVDGLKEPTTEDIPIETPRGFQLYPCLGLNYCGSYDGKIIAAAVPSNSDRYVTAEDKNLFNYDFAYVIDGKARRVTLVQLAKPLLSGLKRKSNSTYNMPNLDRAEQVAASYRADRVPIHTFDNNVSISLTPVYPDMYYIVNSPVHKDKE